MHDNNKRETNILEITPQDAFRIMHAFYKISDDEVSALGYRSHQTALQDVMPLLKKPDETTIKLGRLVKEAVLLFPAEKIGLKLTKEEIEGPLPLRSFSTNSADESPDYRDGPDLSSQKSIAILFEKIQRQDFQDIKITPDTAHKTISENETDVAFNRRAMHGFIHMQTVAAQMGLEVEDITFKKNKDVPTDLRPKGTKESFTQNLLSMAKKFLGLTPRPPNENRL